MSNLIAFNSVFERAVRASDCAGSLIESPTIRVPTSIITFVHEHIHLIEEQLGETQNAREAWKLEAQRTQRQIEALLDAVSATPAARDTLLKLIAETK